MKDFLIQAAMLLVAVGLILSSVSGPALVAVLVAVILVGLVVWRSTLDSASARPCRTH